MTRIAAFRVIPSAVFVPTPTRAEAQAGQWSRLAFWIGVLALVLLPVAIIIHFELQEAGKDAPVRHQMEAEAITYNQSLAACERAVGHKLH